MTNSTNILPWGKLLEKDAAGFIINDCHEDKILPPWTNLVGELRESDKVWSSRLQGLYLRGSVPRGLAIIQVSDLDSFAILSGEITDQDISLSKDISARLKKRYLFCKKVELILLNFPTIQEYHSIWPGIMQTKSLKIAGSDRHFKLLNLPQFKPGFDLVNYAYTWETEIFLNGHFSVIFVF